MIDNVRSREANDRSMSPRRQVSWYFVAYVALTALLMFVNSIAVEHLELPWSWHWAIWTGAFAPVVLATVVIAVFTVPPSNVIGKLWTGSLAAILMVMEGAFLLNATPLIIFLAQLVLIVLFMTVFWAVGRRSVRNECVTCSRDVVSVRVSTDV